MRRGLYQGLSLFLLVIAIAPAAASAKIDWSKTSLGDIEAIHHILKRDTVAAIDPEDPTFRIWLESGYQKAKQMALQVKDVAGFAAVDQYYVNGFHDYHVAIVSRPWPPNMRYPHFLIHYTGTSYLVSPVALDMAGLPAGSTLIDCDSKSPSALMRSKVLPFFGNPALQSSWMINGSRLLTNWQNPFAPVPSHCVFKIGHVLRKISLNWYEVDQASLTLWLKQAAFPYQPKFAIQTLADGAVWVNFPTFRPRNKSPLDLFNMKRISSQFDRFRNNRLVVIDVRGNHGGNSHWADEMLKGLYGNEFFKWAFHSQPPYKSQFRLSALTIATFEKHLKNYQHDFGINNPKTVSLAKYVAKMKRAYQAGHQLYPASIRLKKPNPHLKRPTPLFKGRLVIVMDGRCNSACLTLVYEAKRFPGVTLVGKTSGADTLYTESTSVKLPSNLVLSLSISKSIGRDRGSNQPYYPDYVFPGDINDTPALQKWVLHHQLR